MNRKNNVLNWIGRIAMVAALLLIWSMCSCSTQYVPVESVRYDSVFFEKIRKDSIFVQDSVFVKEKGDTVFTNRLRYIYKYVLKSDTIYISRTDSIQVPYPVEKELSWWEKQKQDLQEVLVIVVFLYALYRLMRWFIMRTGKE